jgi:prepilin-type N-terminal cleavage/methylation domain-containing protein
MAELKKSEKIPALKMDAFSLFESVVAIAIISVLIGIGTLVYSNLVEAERPLAFYQAKEEIDLYYQNLQQSKAFFPKMYAHETYSIEQKVDFYNGNKKIYRIEYLVTSQNKTWYSEKHLITNPDYVQ